MRCPGRDRRPCSATALRHGRRRAPERPRGPPSAARRTPAYTVAAMVMGFLSRFVDSNDREVKRIQPLVDATNALEAELERESDADIRARADEIRAELAELQAGFGPTDGRARAARPRAPP